VLHENVQMMKTVLLVDDNQELVSLYCRMLAMMGYVSMAAKGGRECQEILEEKIPDAILLDVMMEPIDGWETLRMIRKREDCLLTPVIMLTARSPQPREILYCGDFMDGYIMKPVTKTNLEQELQQLWDRCDLIQTHLEKFRNMGASAADAQDYMRSMRACVSLTQVLKTLTPPYLSGGDNEPMDSMVNEEIVRIKERLEEKKERIRMYQAKLG
jgi:two-component system OmpR family response regulator